MILTVASSGQAKTIDGVLPYGIGWTNQHVQERRKK